MKKSTIHPGKYFAYILLVGLSTLLISVEGSGFQVEKTNAELGPDTRRIELVVKKSYLISLQTPTNRVSIVDPAIADVQIIDPKQIMLSAMTTGETSLMIWTDQGKPRMYDVVVNVNIAKIQEMIRLVLPDEAIEVLPMEQGVVLRGEVHKVDSVEKAMEIAQLFTPKVMNYLNVPGVHQVLLKVKVAEVARSFQDELGFNAFYYDKDFQFGNKLSSLMSGDFNVSQGADITFSDAVTLFFGFPKGKVSGFIQALKAKGLIQILAEPNLIARSGETATFLAGGEYPIPIVQASASGNSLTIEYKEFGVKLGFTPIVLTQNTIQLDISPEVSDLDFTRGIKLSGFEIPGLITRRAHTNVKLMDGQTFAIAGLVNQSRQRTHRKVPLVGDIPVLGGLFKNSTMEGKDTELLIMVTPNLISPLEATPEFPLPTSNTVMGKMDSLIEMEKEMKKSIEEKRQESKISKIDIQSEKLPIESARSQEIPVQVEKKTVEVKVNRAKVMGGSSTHTEQSKSAAPSKGDKKTIESKPNQTRIPSGSPVLEPQAKPILPATPENQLLGKPISRIDIPKENLPPGKVFSKGVPASPKLNQESQASTIGVTGVTPNMEIGAVNPLSNGLVSPGEGKKITRAEIQSEKISSGIGVVKTIPNTPLTTSAHLSKDNRIPIRK